MGKTTLALQVVATTPSLYLDLEASADLARLSEPALFLQRHTGKLVILDEVQRLPGLFAELRGLIDAGRRQGQANGRFLLLGSASV
ncbi:MAG: AAA family ATPase [Cyanobium sp.]